MDLLLLIDDDKSHYMYIKDFDRFMFYKTKNKNKNGFVKVVYSVLVVKVCCWKIRKIIWVLMVNSQ